MFIVPLKQAAVSLACIITPFANHDVQMGANLNLTPVQKEQASQFYQSIKTNSQNPQVIGLANQTLNRLNSSNMKPGKEVSVPLSVQGSNNYSASVLLNKKSISSFRIDTRATYTVISPQLANQMHIQPTAETPTVKIVTNSGLVAAPLVTIDSIVIGGVEVKKVQAVIFPLGNSPTAPSGLLGMNFFQNMGMNIKNGQLILSISSLP